MSQEVIRRATIKDLEIIQDFIETEWLKGHILSTSKLIFDWQYFDKQNSVYNFFLAFVNKKLTGILGYTSNKQYDPTLCDSVNWLSMWKISRDAMAGQGLRLLTTIESQTFNQPIGTIGLKPNTKFLYEKMGFHTGELRHYFVPASNSPVNQVILFNFQDSTVREKTDDKTYIDSIETDLESVIKSLISEFVQALPRGKSVFFYLNRYLHCPFYLYKFSALYDHNYKKIGFMVYRIIEHPDYRILRILEIVSTKSFINLYDSIAELNNTLKIQYADYYEDNSEQSQQAKFDLAIVKDTTQLPNLFEPLVKEKKKFLYAVKNTMGANYVLTRGDCDQDRPNKI